MEDVTDFVFREIVSDLPKPDVFFTEFTNADGLCSAGKSIVMQKLKYTENQRPIVAQIWGTDIGNLSKSAKLIKDLKFDGVDINMACPVRAVINKGAGGALIKNFELTKQIIAAVKRGAPDIPVSVKTRLGFDTIDTREWIRFLLEQKLDAITIHGRTVRQMSKGEANWEEIGKAVKIKNKIAPQTILLGNGDIKSYKQAREMYGKYCVDGVMIGRGIFSNPWIFAKINESKLHTKEEYIELLLKHIKLFEKTWGTTKNFEILKKFFKMYIRDFSGANLLRQKLMNCKNSIEVKEVLKSDNLL